MVSEYIYYVANIVSQKECSKNKNKIDKKQGELHFSFFNGRDDRRLWVCFSAISPWLIYSLVKRIKPQLF